MGVAHEVVVRGMVYGMVVMIVEVEDGSNGCG